jgi:hypothetical protein
MATRAGSGRRRSAPEGSTGSLHERLDSADGSYVSYPPFPTPLAAYQSLDRFDPCYSTSSPKRDTASAASAGAPAGGDGRHERRSAEVRWLLGIAWRQVSHCLDRSYRRREVPRGRLTAPCFQAADLAPSSEQRIAERQRRLRVYSPAW